MADIHIETLTGRYEVGKDLGQSAIAARLDHIARHRLPAALETATAGRGWTECSGVIDHIDVTSRLSGISTLSDAEIARRWAGDIALAIERRLTQRDRVTVYSNDAERLASLLGDHLRGRPSDGQSASRGVDLQALMKSIMSVGGSLAEVLGRIDRQEGAPGILAELDNDAITLIGDALRSQARDQHETRRTALRPLLTAAAMIAEFPKVGSYFEESLSCFAHQVTYLPSWSDTAALSELVLQAFDSLTPPHGGRSKATPGKIPAGLSWLDRDLLERGLRRRHFAKTNVGAPTQSVSDRFAPVQLSPRQLATLRMFLGGLDALSNPKSATVCAIARLAADQNGWMPLPQTLVAIHASCCWAIALRRMKHLPLDWHSKLKEGALPKLAETVPATIVSPVASFKSQHGPWIASLLSGVIFDGTQTTIAEASDPEEMPLRLSDPLDVKAANSKGQSVPAPHVDPSIDRIRLDIKTDIQPDREAIRAGWLSMKHAGLAVALRAISDASLTRVLANTTALAPTLPVQSERWIAALLARWAGDGSFDETERLDRGLAILSGLDDPPTRQDLLATFSPCSEYDFSIVTRTLEGGAKARAVAWKVAAASIPDDRLEAGCLGNAVVDEAIETLGAGLLSGWAHWLKGFASASQGFLLERMLRRRGALQVSDETIEVRLQPGAYDMILRMAGYFDPLSHIPWLGSRRLILSVERPS